MKSKIGYIDAPQKSVHFGLILSVVSYKDVCSLLMIGYLKFECVSVPEKWVSLMFVRFI